MSRAYVVYVLTFLVFIGGMALIMTMGDAVRAADDLSGVWEIEWDNAPPPESGEPIMKVAQSGRFFVVTFGRRAPQKMVLQEGWRGKEDGRTLRMTLADGVWKLRLAGPIPSDQQWEVPELKLELVGPTRHVGIARRVPPDGEIAQAGSSESDAPSGVAETAHAR